MATIPKKKKPTTKRPPRKDFSKLEELAESIGELRKQQKDLGEEIAVLQEDAIREMEALRVKSHSFKGADGHQHKINRQQNTSIVIDEVRLKKALGANLWNKVTTRHLDKKKLEAFIASGEVDVKKVAECSEDKVGNPFVKVT